MLFQPKTISIGDFTAVTAERHLAFVPAQSDDSILAKALDDARQSFETQIDTGLPFRADMDTLSITIIPTTSCNLRCIYCYSDGGNVAVDLEEQYAIDVFDSLMERYPNIHGLNLFFAGGGEPLLRIDIMKEILTYVHSRGFQPQIRLVTNGVLVPENLSWLRKNSVYLRISYDGSAQNLQRPGCNFDSNLRLKSTLSKIRDRYRSDLVSVQMTITEANVSTIADDVINMVEQYGIQTFKIEPVQTSCSQRSRNVPSPDPSLFVHSILDTLDRLVKMDAELFLDLSYLSVPSTEYFCSLRNKIVISPYSVLSPCVETIKPDEMNNMLIWQGGVPKRNDFDIIEAVQRERFDSYHPKSYPICSRCELVHICKGNCPMRLILAGKKEGPFEYNCMIAKELIPAFLKRAAKDERYMRLVFGESYNKSEECF